MGKTSFALNIAEHCAIAEKKPVAVFSLEMSREELLMRMLCSQARVDMHKVRRGYLDTRRAAQWLAWEAQTRIDDGLRQTWEWGAAHPAEVLARASAR